MRKLEFKTTGGWKLQGSSEKELYISLVAKIDDWKKSIVFYRSEIEKEAFDFLLQSILEPKDLVDWKFSISTQRRYMNSIYASQVFWIRDKSEKIIFTGSEEGKNI